MEFIEDFKKVGLIYTGCHLSAFTNKKGEIKKKLLLPTEWQTRKHAYKYDETIHNSIAVLTQLSKLSTIDVDIPEECPILGQLQKDCKFYVKTRKGYHFYFKENKAIPRRQQTRIADFNTDSLLFTPKYTHIETKEEFKYELIKKSKIVEMPEYAVKWCQDLINTPKADKPKKDGKKKTSAPVIKDDRKIDIYDLGIIKIICEILYDNGYFEEFKKWSTTAFILRHLNNSEKSFKLFDKFSRKSGKYDEKEEDNRTAFYGKYTNKFNENGVLMLCKKLNKIAYCEKLSHLYKSAYEKEFNYLDEQYIYPHKMFDDWMDDKKVLMIKSNYGTGKTYAFKQLIEKHKYKKILFITYRQSLANSLERELKEKYQFDNYLDKSITNLKDSNRAIVQLDSIKRLFEHDNYFTKPTLPKYDLVVLDEIEGILNHLSYEKINQPVIFERLNKLITNSKKILCLDGDLNDRSFDFISDITDDYMIYVNKYQPNKKHFTFLQNLKKFDAKIHKDLSDGKKVVIVSMTKTDTIKYKDKYKKEDEKEEKDPAMKYYHYYKDKYNVIIHNGYERNKKILENPNEEWIKADLLIYSPTVESGVDFNVKNHFDKCYSILTNKSTSYRALNQMLNRVRYYNDNNVVCYSGVLKHHPHDVLFRYEEIKTTKYNDLDETPLLKIIIHNDVEKNNNKHFFMKSFIDSILEKGHTYKIDTEDKFSKNTENPKQVQKMIVKADDIENSKYLELIENQRENKELTQDENIQVEKHIYKVKWLVDTIDEEFLDNHYRMNGTLGNYKKMQYETPEIENQDYLTKIKYKKIEKVKSILEGLGYKIEEDIITADKATEDVKGYIEKLFQNKDFRMLFDGGRKLKKNNHLNELNNIINNYGYEIKKSRKNIRVDGKLDKKYIHTLKHLDIIIDYLERRKAKYKLLDEEEDESLK